MKHKTMDDFFQSIGFGFPETERQLEDFNCQIKVGKLKANPEKIDPAEILSSLLPATNTDFFKRTVLAAEIIYQLKDENTLGHLKLQKLMYLCQHTTGMNLQTNFLKQAMGPYDPRLMRSIDKQMKNKNWFVFTKDKFPKYQPLENAGEHTQWYNRYFTDQKDKIDSMLKIFKTATSSQVELVATIFACCLESQKNKEIINEVTIVNKVYAWSKDKEKFSEQQITSAHTWMQEKGIYP